MIGIELDRPCGELVAVARDAGVLINVTSDTVIRLVPPLIYGEVEVDALVTAVSGLLKKNLPPGAGCWNIFRNSRIFRRTNRTTFSNPRGRSSRPCHRAG